MSTVTATVTEPTEAPREGLAVLFQPTGNDHAPVIALTDASGVFRAALADSTAYVWRYRVD